MSEPSDDFINECMRWRGRVLRGKYAHWCFEWDELPIDETCPEWPCGCGFKEWKDNEDNEKARAAIAEINGGGDT